MKHMPLATKGSSPRRQLAIVVLLAMLSVAAFAPAASAATQTHTSSFTLTGSAGPQTLSGLRVLCDGCAPDDLFDCGDGCEIAGGIEVSLTSAIDWSAPIDIDTSADPDALHQGSTATVSNLLKPGAGTLTLKYTLNFTVGLFGKGGNFPSDDWHPSTDTISDSVEKTATASCTPAVGGNTTCGADVELPFFDECFLTGCPVEVIVSLIVKNTITISPTGVVVSRSSSFQSPGNLTLGASAVGDPLSVPCNATLGSSVGYTLANPAYGPTGVSVTGSLALGIFVDGPGPANLEEDVDLPISGNAFNGNITLSSSQSSGFTLGSVLADNVAPTLAATIPAGPLNEGSTATVTGSAGDNCPVRVTIDWGEGTVDSLGGSATSQGISRGHVYGDNGAYPIEVCARDAYTSTCTDGEVQIDNVAPTAAIGSAGSTVINGQEAFLAHAGEALALSGRSTDPGSDDLTLAWNWGDGTAGATTVSLVNPPTPDPPLSPSVQPRDVTDSRSHTFGEACMYTVTFTATDDDGGSSSDTAPVIIVGNASGVRGAGYWQTNLVGKGTREFSTARLNCYLATVAFMSSVFNEHADASTISKAVRILKMGVANNATPTAQFDRELLTAWLNFANGALGLEELVDTNGDKTPDSSFGDVIASAELVRLDASSTASQILAQKDILERVNGGA